jgi:hypothetical protein
MALASVTNEAVNNTPLASPASKQQSAVAATGSSATLVDGSDFNRLLGIAVDSGLATQSADVVTFDLNLFALKAMIDPSVIQSQKRYQEHAFLRRFSGALSFGGVGESVDRDGDGMLDEALPAESLDDIVTLDLRFRLSSQSRDRRDKDNFEEIQRNVSDTLSELNVAQGEISIWFVKNNFRQGQSCAELDTRIESIDESILEELGLGLQAFQADYNEIIKGIDSRTVWTLGINATERSREFGGDKWRVGIRGAMGGDNQGWTVNLDYGESEMPAMEDARMLRGGLEWKTNVWQEKVGRDGIAASISAAFEQFDNVPGAIHDGIAKVNVKFVYPLTSTLNIPFSITWANHADLLTDESDVRGNIGFTVDFDRLVSAGIQ